MSPFLLFVDRNASQDCERSGVNTLRHVLRPYAVMVTVQLITAVVYSPVFHQITHLSLYHVPKSPELVVSRGRRSSVLRQAPNLNILGVLF